MAARKPKSTIDKILADTRNPAYRRVSSARILIRQDLVALSEQLDAELQDALAADAKASKFGSLDDAPAAPAVAQRRADLQAEFEASKVEFRFGAIGRRPYQDLLLDHPATDEQRKLIRGIDHNPETFPVALMAASWIDPDNSSWKFDPGNFDEDDQAEFDRRTAFFGELEEQLNFSQFEILLHHSLDANTGFDAPKANPMAGHVLRQNSPSASTAAAEGSPDLSSLDGSSGQG